MTVWDGLPKIWRNAWQVVVLSLQNSLLSAHSGATSQRSWNEISRRISTCTNSALINVWVHIEIASHATICLCSVILKYLKYSTVYNFMPAAPIWLYQKWRNIWRMFVSIQLLNSVLQQSCTFNRYIDTTQCAYSTKWSIAASLWPWLSTHTLLRTRITDL